MMIKGPVLYLKKCSFDQITNDEWLIDQEKELLVDPVGYYEKRKDSFYQRDSILNILYPLTDH